MLKLVDLCDQLVFLGVENSGNMWRKRKQDPGLSACRFGNGLCSASFRQEERSYPLRSTEGFRIHLPKEAFKTCLKPVEFFASCQNGL